jgi:PadR family transcriptional regulator PadR
VSNRASSPDTDVPARETRETSNREAPTRERGRADVLQGTLDLMVLQTLDTLGPLHGYAIAARLEQVSNGALQLNMGTLYPALMRLEQRRLVTGNWGTTDTNRKARFYKLTPAGRRELGREKDAWNRMAGIMHALLHGEG